MCRIVWDIRQLIKAFALQDLVQLAFAFLHYVKLVNLFSFNSDKSITSHIFVPYEYYTGIYYYQ